MTPLPGAWPQKPGSATFPFFGVQVNTIYTWNKDVWPHIFSKAFAIYTVYSQSLLTRKDRRLKENVAGIFALRNHGLGLSGPSMETMTDMRPRTSSHLLATILLVMVAAGNLLKYFQQHDNEIQAYLKFTTIWFTFLNSLINNIFMSGTKMVTTGLLEE